MLKSFLVFLLVAGASVSTVHAQPVVYDMGVDDEPSFQAFRSALLKSAYVSTDYSVAPNPRVVAAITATMVFVSSNPLATNQEISDFLSSYSNELGSFDLDDPNFDRKSTFLAALRRFDRGSASYVHSGLDTRVSKRMFEVLDIQVPAPLDFDSTQKRMVEYENARLRSFTNSPDWSMILTLALYGQDLDGNANQHISGIVESYLVSEGFTPVPADPLQAYYQNTSRSFMTFPFNFLDYNGRLNSLVDPNNIDDSELQGGVQAYFEDLQGNAAGLISDISGAMVNPPTVIEAAENALDTNYLQQQVAIYEANLLADATARSGVGWRSMMLLQHENLEVQNYSTAARDFSHIRLETNASLSNTNLWIDLASGLAQTGIAVAKKDSGATIAGGTQSLLTALAIGQTFSDAPSVQSSDEQIFNQILLVRQDIDGMRVQMHDRFDRIEEQLNTIYSGINQSFGVLGASIDDLQGDIEDAVRATAENNAALERIEDALYGMFADTMWNQLALDVNLLLNYRETNDTDLPYDGGTTEDYTTAVSDLMTWCVTTSGSTVYAGENNSLLTSFDDALGVLSGSSIGRNVNDLRTFPTSLGLNELSGTRVVAAAPWTQGASVLTQLAHESPWYFAFRPGSIPEIDSVIDKGEDLLTMMEAGRSASLFNALLDGYSQVITDLSVRESQVLAEVSSSIFPSSEFDIFGGLTQPAVQQALPAVPRLTIEGFGTHREIWVPNNTAGWNDSDSWNIFMTSQDPNEKDIAPLLFAMVNDAALDIGQTPVHTYTWDLMLISPVEAVAFLTFEINGGAKDGSLHARIVRDIHFYKDGDFNGNYPDFKSREDAIRFFSGPVWALISYDIMINDVNVRGNHYFSGFSSIDILDDRSSQYFLTNGRERAHALLENLKSEAWETASTDSGLIAIQQDSLHDWSALLEAYATLSMPDLIAESTVASAALRGKASGPISELDPTIIDYRDSSALAVDIQKFYELNAIDPANALYAEERLRSNWQALSDSIDIWLTHPFPGHGYINYMLSELYELKENKDKLAIDDRYTTGNKLVVSAANGLLANDVDQEFRTLEIDIYSQPSGGNLTVNPDGSFIFELTDLNLDQTSFTYTSSAVITDGGGTHVSNTATVILVVIEPDTETFVAVPSQYPTIAQAIEVIISDPNSVIELAPGTYNEMLNTQGKAFTLRSASGNPEDTIISGQSLSYRVLTINSGEGRDTVIQGITIREGVGTGYPWAGGGILITDAEPTIRNCIFAENFAFNLGGAIAISGTKTPLIVNSVFYENSSRSGGAIGTFQHLLDDVPETGNAIILNCSFFKNRDLDGNAGAIFFDPLSTNSVVENSILWLNNPNEISGSGATVRHSIVLGGIPAGVVDGGGNLSVDPLFTGSFIGDMTLRTGSPAIDAGSNTPPELAGILTDLDGNPRFVDDLDTVDTGVGPAPIIDMGAYEFQYVAPPCPADFTGDGIINFFDISVFLQLFGDEDPEADFTGEGVWDFFDVSAFLQAFTAGCP